VPVGLRRILNRAIAGLCLLALAGLVIAGTFVLKRAHDMDWLVKAIASRCAASRDATGYGAVVITTDLTIEGTSGVIPTSCRVYLRNGVHLTIRRVQLHTASLWISNWPVLHPTSQGLTYTLGQDWPAQTSVATSVTIDGSSLVGGSGSRIQFGLMEKSDRLSVIASTIDYPLLVQAAIGNDAVIATDQPQGGGFIDIRDSTIRALDERGFGIQIQASQDSGSALFRNVDFETRSHIYTPAFLQAGTCHADRVQGITADCQTVSGPRLFYAEVTYGGAYQSGLMTWNGVTYYVATTSPATYRALLALDGSGWAVTAVPSISPEWSVPCRRSGDTTAWSTVAAGYEQAARAYCDGTWGPGIAG
jgi:hypothetical protein